jgi:hypothetical protein
VLQVGDAERAGGFGLPRQAEQPGGDVHARHVPAAPGELAGDPAVPAGDVQDPLAAHVSHQREQRDRGGIAGIGPGEVEVEISDQVVAGDRLVDARLPSLPRSRRGRHRDSLTACRAGATTRQPGDPQASWQPRAGSWLKLGYGLLELVPHRGVVGRDRPVGFELRLIGRRRCAVEGHQPGFGQLGEPSGDVRRNRRIGSLERRTAGRRRLPGRRAGPGALPTRARQLPRAAGKRLACERVPAHHHQTADHPPVHAG